MKKKNILLLLSAVTLSSFLSFAQSGLDVRYDPDGATGPLPTTGSNLAGGMHSISLYPGSPDLSGVFTKFTLLLQIQMQPTNNTRSYANRLMFLLLGLIKFVGLRYVTMLRDQYT